MSQAINSLYSRPFCHQHGTIAVISTVPTFDRLPSRKRLRFQLRRLKCGGRMIENLQRSWGLRLGNYAPRSPHPGKTANFTGPEPYFGLILQSPADSDRNHSIIARFCRPGAQFLKERGPGFTEVTRPPSQRPYGPDDNLNAPRSCDSILVSRSQERE